MMGRGTEPYAMLCYAVRGRIPNFHIFWSHFCQFLYFSINFEPFWIASGTPGASFLAVFLDEHFWSEFFVFFCNFLKK